jgi:hypothetical protein
MPSTEPESAPSSWRGVALVAFKLAVSIILLAILY